MTRASLLVIALGLAPGACGGDGGTQGIPAGACATDADCGGDVCTRLDECDPASDVRAVRLAWTIKQGPATAQACMRFAAFNVAFESSATGEQVDYAPVQCSEGAFYVDKWPARFDRGVVAGYDDGVPSSGTATWAATGDVDVTIDVEPNQ